MEMGIEELLERIFSDKGIPRNIKNSIEEAVQQLETETRAEDKIPALVSILDEVSSDINISPTARTEIWNVLSELERLGSRH